MRTPEADSMSRRLRVSQRQGNSSERKKAEKKRKRSGKKRRALKKRNLDLAEAVDMRMNRPRPFDAMGPHI